MSIEGIRFRTLAEGQIVLQVLEREEQGPGYYREARGAWRDARVEDLLQVARYTRSSDALDNLISGLQSTVSDLQNQVAAVLDQNQSILSSG